MTRMTPEDARCDCTGWMVNCSCDFIPEARLAARTHIHELESCNDCRTMWLAGHKSALAIQIAARSTPAEALPRRAQQCSACHRVTCSECGYVVPPDDRERFVSHVCLSPHNREAGE